MSVKSGIKKTKYYQLCNVWTFDTVKIIEQLFGQKCSYRGKKNCFFTNFLTNLDSENLRQMTKEGKKNRL